MAPKQATKITPAHDGEVSLRARTQKPVTKKAKEKLDRQKAAAEEIAALSDHFKAIKENDKKMRAQRDDTMDSEFWIAICFQNRAQKEEFLRLVKFPKTIGDKYLDGMKVAKILGVKLTTPVPPKRKHKHEGKFFADLALDIDGSV
jgi:hypothetical protein